MVLNGRQSQQDFFRALKEMTQPTHCHLQPADAWSDFCFSDILVRVPIGPQFLVEPAVLGANQHPTAVDRKSHLLRGLSKVYNGKRTGEAG